MGNNGSQKVIARQRFFFILDHEILALIHDLIKSYNLFDIREIFSMVNETTKTKVVSFKLVIKCRTNFFFFFCFLL